MKSYVVYLDQHQAKVFEFQKGEKHKESFSTGSDGRTGHSSQKHAHGKHVEHPSPEEKKFYHDLAHRLGDASEILILGPGLGKVHFQKHLEEHHKPLSTKVVGVETLDHITENQMLAHARKFFRAHDLFSAIG